MKKIIVTLVIIFAGLWLIPWRNVNWGKFSTTQLEVVTVSGEAKTTVTNQIATFQAGVSAHNDNKEAALKEVSDKVTPLIEKVKAFGIKKEDIQTENMSVYQNQTPYYDNGVQRLKLGQWQVNNSISITLRDASRASQLADLLNGSGATNVYGPSFRLDDTDQAEKGLYDAAIKDAKDKAMLIAKASGRTLGKVVMVNDGSPNYMPVYNMAYKAMDISLSSAPVETGSTTVTKNLTVSFELL